VSESERTNAANSAKSPRCFKLSFATTRRAVKSQDKSRFAQVLGRVLGKDVRYKQVTIEELQQG
jgi:hypothetical protein